MIRIAVLAACALGALATPALAFQTSQAPAGHEKAAHFTDTSKFSALMPDTASETLHIGQPIQDKATVIYELHPDGKPAGRLDLTDSHDNPFMAQPERRTDAGH